MPPPASAGGELASKDTFPPADADRKQLEDLPSIGRGGVVSVQLKINNLIFINLLI